MIKTLINRPVVVIIGMILLSLFGILSLSTMPYQLTPQVTRPVISVNTTWSGATPYEIEREILERQEQVLKGIDNLETMEGFANNGRANVTLEFKIGTDLTKAMLDVSNKLNEVKGYPDDIDRPVIRATGEDTNPVVRMMLVSIDARVNVRESRTFFNENVIQYFERIDGVAEVSFPGGDDREMHVIIDDRKLAIYQLDVARIANVLDKQNINLSAGSLDYGRKSYRVRTVGEFKSPQDILDVVIWSDGVKRVKISDVAIVKEGFENKTTASYYRGDEKAPKEALFVAIKPTADANVLELTNAVEVVFNTLNDGILKDNGLKLEWTNDQRDYIQQAIALVKANIIIGAFLACGVLFVFLRSFTSTLIIAVAMPLSVFGTFIVMAFLNRTLNVVSLAGISFAVGMLVDSAIVVLENIDRHKKMRKSPMEAVVDGTKEVIGGLVASVLTTVAIFIPILNIQEEAGQLFRDIALAASAAVSFSLFVSIIVIPTLSYQSSKFLGVKQSLLAKSKNLQEVYRSGSQFSLKIREFGQWFVDWVMFFVQTSMQSMRNKILTILSLTFLSLAFSYVLLPKMEYLPQGNQNFVFGRIIPPPGLSYSEKEKIGQEIFSCLGDYFASSGFEENANYPAIANLFYVGGSADLIFGLRALQTTRAADLIPLAKTCIQKIPGVSGTALQTGIFERRGSSRGVDIDISGENIESLIVSAITLEKIIKEVFVEKYGEKNIATLQMRARPSLEILYPELNLYPNLERISAVGLDVNSFGVALDVLLDGRKIAEYKEEGREKIDLVLKSQNGAIYSPEELYNASIYTSVAGIIPISTLADLKLEYGTNQIRHYERKRTITLMLNPPSNITIQESMELISGEILERLKASGALENNSISLSGTANQLTTIKNSLLLGFVLAVFIIYLLMAALYEDFIYPLIILFSVPLAVGGGFLGLWLVNVFLVYQPLDVLTMLGFIILVGIVVNNAILIVYQSLHNVRLYGMDAQNGILEAVRVRIRPIYMSTLTSLFGMLPLVVAPGAGSEIYRGLGAVILGGLGFSTVLSIFLIPCLLSFFIKREIK
ncbi:efflux RND transporter permease subunit [Helicobacter sp. MIT 11-5569]|uniref:efflux RND transporter permease subunit n=1 Tax=Helicobacter sp. MIT 11-5569 TaxID=1548151 RepID=UPI00051F92DD|nr:efflux RND transporter permease subunit [Helicobacter sp. MIT 11-5569]TLD80614.1 efflux RND transporter permease subunit [Helicobacter sp. MIT 11-5569]